MSAHTPGQWQANLYQEGAFDISAQKSGGGELILCTRSKHSTRFDEMHDKAVLSAAAPEWLEALKVMLKDCDQSVETALVHGSEVEEMARAAIAKAEGTKP